jgi:tetratricopeptide (TPR) repeat protein
VIGAYHKCVAETVARFDGFVAKYMGDGVLVYFGYPAAHEDDAERAVRAGLALVDAVASLAAPQPLQVRIGVATGLVVVGDLVGSGEAQERGIVGETPNLAARLQGIAEPNMVVIGEGTRRLIGNLFELQDLGRKELKGIAGQTQAWAALRASSVTSRFEALRATGLTALVGRERELETLERGLADARSQFRVIDIVAEPGIGKSRLVHEFRQRIGKERAFVLSGYCSPDGQQTPFLPFIEVVRGSFRVSVGEPEEHVAQKLEIGLTAVGLHSTRNLGLLLHLLGLKVPEGALTGLDGVLIGLRTRELLQQLLEARCRLSPVVLVIEDLHWIDSVSDEMLGKIVDSERKLRLLVVHTRRPEYEPAWLGNSAVTKLSLEPLPAGDIRRLVQARLGADSLPEALARQVAEKAEGNPLFAEEIVSYLTERVLLRANAGTLEFDASAVAAALPGSVQGLLTARVDRLAPKDRALLQAASVIGRRFDPELLATVVTETDIDARLSEMQVLDLVRIERKSSDYVFKHALVRDALYQSLLREVRTKLHEKVAEEIERRSGNRLTEVAEILAHHYGQTNNAGKAFAYLSMAGSKSLGVYSLDEATTHFAAALALLDKNPHSISDDLFAEFFVSYALLLNMRVKITALIEVLSRYLSRISALGDDPRAVLIRHHHVFGLLWNARYREAAAMQRELSLVAGRLGDSRSKAYALAGEIIVSAIIAPKPLQEFEVLKKRAIQAASDTNDAYIQNWTRWVIGWDGTHRGRMNDARDSARELLEVGRVLNDPRSTGFGLNLLSWIALLSDSYTEALEYSEQSLSVAVTPWDRTAATLAKVGALMLLRRRTEEAAQLLHEQRRRITVDGDFYSSTATEPMLGVYKVLQGNMAEGLHIFEQLISQFEEEGYQMAATWNRFNLAQAYLEIIAGHEKPKFIVLLRNLPFLLKIMLTASSRIEALTASIQTVPHYDPDGFLIGKSEMIVGMLYKTKKKHAVAARHLNEAKRILTQFGQTPILARVETALAELRQ